MSTPQPLLLELFTEELPPRALLRMGEAFAQAIFDGLKKRELLAEDASFEAFATPRRLAVRVSQVRDASPAKAFEAKLMPIAVALDAEGKPTAALLKKLAAIGLSEEHVGKLTRKSDGKVEALYHAGTSDPAPLAGGLQDALHDAIKNLPIPKLMTYQLADGEHLTNIQFARPVHSLLALHGEQVVPLTAFGLESGRVTRGHRFQSAGPLEIGHAADYESRLEKDGAVIASFGKRMHEIERLLEAHAEQCGDTLGDRSEYTALLEEVTALVERPAVYVGKFDAEFLSVPAECLTLTMKLNQKYFPLFHSEGGLSSRFLVVSNMLVNEPQRIIEGNERVVRPRLADAKFFFEQDQKKTLESRVPGLSKVMYQAKLGSQLDRVGRVQKLAGTIASLVGAIPSKAERAAYLAKADLLTDMVGEFPELQGVMGRYYALSDGEPREVAEALEQQYWPRGAGDRLPTGPEATALALADKLETLAGMFGIGQVPTGDKDPFALRRHALGVVRMLVEKKLDVDLGEIIDAAYSVFDKIGQSQTDLHGFILERLRSYLRDLGYSSNEIEAVLARGGLRLDIVPAQLAAVRSFLTLPEAESLVAANKRIGNILKKTNESFTNTDSSRFAEPAEKAVFAAMRLAQPQFEKYFSAGDYSEALKTLAPLKAPVDAFFDNVMVNVDDKAVRENRLALLGDLHALMNRVADLSKLAA